MKLISNVITLSLLSSSILLGADIDTSKKAITVANVGSLSKAKKIANKLSNHDVYIYRSEESLVPYFMVYAVNIKYENRSKHLKKIREKFNSAYISSNKRINRLASHNFEENIFLKSTYRKVEGNKIKFTKDSSEVKIVKEQPNVVETIEQEPVTQVISQNIKAAQPLNKEPLTEYVLKEVNIEKNKPKSIKNSSQINIKSVRKQEQVIIKKPSKPLIKLVGVKQYLPPMKEDKGGKKILVKSFSIEDAFGIKNDELQSLLKENKNKELTFSQVQNLASIITKEYRDRGYFVARAYIPVQKLKDGNLKIVVVEGQYGDFKLINKSLVKDSVVQGFLDNTKLTGTVRTASVDKASLEKTMLLINDLPGVVISKANVKPGRVVGTSDFDIVASTKASYDGYLLADNYGGYYTGEERLMGGINFNSPFNAGDKLSLSGLISKGEDLINGAMSYQVPLNYSGLNAQLSYSDTTYHLTEDLSSLDAQGNSKSVGMKFTYPLLRSRLENLYTSLNFSHNILEDETRSTNDMTQKTSNVATIALDYDKSDVIFDIENQTKVSFGLTHGNLKFKNQDKKDDDAVGSNTQGNFTKLNFEVSEDMYLTDKLSVESSLYLQYALNSKNLDGSEDFSVGGAYGVKLYPSGELSAENGYLFNIETKYLLPKIYGVSNTLGLFYDIGKADMANNAVGFEKRTLQDIGLGYYLNYNNFFTNIQAAWAIDNEEITSEPNGNSRILFLGGMSF